MNVAIAIDELDMGGAQHVVYELVKHIDCLKYNVTIICTDGNIGSLLETKMLKESHGGYSILFLKNRNTILVNTGITIVDKIINKIKRAIMDIGIIIELYDTLKKITPDIIHAHQHGIWAAFWAIPHRIPLVTTIHTNPEATFPRETERFIFYVTLLLRYNILVGISQYNSERIKTYWNLSDTYVRYINNGIEIHTFYTKPHETFAFINVSRQDENKNQSLILRAFARLCRENPKFPMKLYLIGDGVCHTFLKQEAQALEIQNWVEFTGYIPSARDYLSVSDVYISAAHREGLSLSVLEAMAVGLPIIATDVGGVRDLAQENGILIEDDDENSLYAAMRKMRDNRELREVKSRKSLEMVQAYSASEMARQYSMLYDVLVKR